MPPGARVKRQASIEELKALAHPARWRILRLCLDQSLTNQEIAERMSMSPATTLRHVRALADVGFLVAEPVRPGMRGARERPYRATGRTWGLVAVDLDEPELVQRVDLAILAAHRAELLAAGPDSGRDLSRGIMRLGPESVTELKERLEALLLEFRDRDEPGGEPLSYLWSLVARPLPAQGLRAAERRAANAVSRATSVIATATGRICGT
jgi:DNA-binding transcriptional ArsR family regulator